MVDVKKDEKKREEEPQGEGVALVADIVGDERAWMMGYVAARRHAVGDSASAVKGAAKEADLVLEEFKSRFGRSEDEEDEKEPEEEVKKDAEGLPMAPASPMLARKPR